MLVVRSLDSTDGDEILRVLQDDGGYAARVNGEQADSRTVASLLNDKPSEVGADGHHVRGLWLDDELAGVACRGVAVPGHHVSRPSPAAHKPSRSWVRPCLSPSTSRRVSGAVASHGC